MNPTYQVCVNKTSLHFVHSPEWPIIAALSLMHPSQHTCSPVLQDDLTEICLKLS